MKPRETCNQNKKHRRSCAGVRLFFITNGHDVIGCGLVHKVVEPVGEQQIGMSSPAYDGVLGIIIVGEIIFRNIDGQTLVFIPQVLCFQGFRIVFGMTGDKDLAAALVGNSINACFSGINIITSMIRNGKPATSTFSMVPTSHCPFPTTVRMPTNAPPMAWDHFSILTFPMPPGSMSTP